MDDRTDYRAGVAESSPTVEEVAELRADHERLAAEREHYRELYLRTLEQYRKLELGLLGQKTERLSPNDAQVTMQVLATLLGPARRSRLARSRGTSPGSPGRKYCRPSKRRSCRT
jgi:transposase